MDGSRMLVARGSSFGEANALHGGSSHVGGVDVARALCLRRVEPVRDRDLCVVCHDADCALLLCQQHLILAPHACCVQRNPLENRRGCDIRCTSLDAPGEASKLDAEQGSTESG